MEESLLFVKVEFPEDENVAGWGYWYLSPYAVAVGERVLAPLGRHNRLQSGIVRAVCRASAERAPYPVDLIKKIAKVQTQSEEL